MTLDLHCAICFRGIDPPREDYLREVTGWLRPQGTGGGQVVQREPTGRIAHRKCVEYGPRADHTASLLGES